MTRRSSSRLATGLVVALAVGAAVLVAGAAGRGPLAPAVQVDALVRVLPGSALDPDSPDSPDGPGGPDEAGSATDTGPADRLDPELERRFAEAQAAAAAEGVSLEITSGLRSVAEQERLVAEARERYGSEEGVHRWVAPPEASSHVQGRAIDVGATEGAYWLQQHGAAFGLCPVFANEVWHFEATIEPGGTCPPVVPDASGLWP
jgi:hypothetical protein